MKAGLCVCAAVLGCAAGVFGAAERGRAPWAEAKRAATRRRKRGSFEISR